MRLIDGKDGWRGKDLVVAQAVAFPYATVHELSLGGDAPRSTRPRRLCRGLAPGLGVTSLRGRKLPWIMRRHDPRHPLLSPFPVVVAAVATFLVVLAFLSAQLRAGGDPGLSAARIASAQPRVPGSPAATTRQSGGSGAYGSASARVSSLATPVSTHQSGGGEQD